MEKGILFLAHLKSSDYKKEQAALSAPDTWVDIHLDKSRIRHYEGTDIGLRMKELGHITLRMVKVPLPEEREEVLVTNLPSETFDSRQIAELYHMRWGIETEGAEPFLLLYPEELQPAAQLGKGDGEAFAELLHSGKAQEILRQDAEEEEQAVA